jgi:hypothetical protein
MVSERAETPNTAPVSDASMDEYGAVMRAPIPVQAIRWPSRKGIRGKCLWCAERPPAEVIQPLLAQRSGPEVRAGHRSHKRSRSISRDASPHHGRHDHLPKALDVP